MDSKVKIFALGGLDEEGKDCYCVDVDGDLFVIECGIREPDKTMPGVDYVMPRFDYLVANKNRIKGYFLTHGHDDAMGGLAYLYQAAPAPIYGSKVSIEMLKMFTRHVKKDPSMYEFHVVEVHQAACRTPEIVALVACGSRHHQYVRLISGIFGPILYFNLELGPLGHRSFEHQVAVAYDVPL